MGKSVQQTWQQFYAPMIAGEIETLRREHPDMALSRIRWHLGRMNPGPYGWQKKVWGKESTRQINRLKGTQYPLVNPKPNRAKLYPERQLKLF